MRLSCLHLPTVVTRGWRAWVMAARPRTLPAAATPVVVGTTLAAG